MFRNLASALKLPNYLLQKTRNNFTKFIVLYLSMIFYFLKMVIDKALLSMISVECDKVFSKVCIIINKRRNCLYIEKLN